MNIRPSLFLNAFLVQAIIWLLVLALYICEWSDLNERLSQELIIFLFVLITASAIIAILFKRISCFVPLNQIPKHPYLISAILIGIALWEAATVGSLNFEWLGSGTEYSRVNGIPYLHVIIIVASTYYSIYLFFAYICFRMKRYLIVSAALLIVFIASFNRMQILICVVADALIALSSFDWSKANKRKLVFMSIIGAFIVMYAFGAVGNIRSGYGYNDTSYFRFIASYNEKWPSWLPYEYMWTYTYLTDPLANLSVNINKGNTSYDLLRFIYSLFPESFSKYLPNGGYSIPTFLPVSAFTVSTGFLDAYKYGGFAGMYVFLGVTAFLQVLASSIVKGPDRTILLSLLCISNIIMVFDNAFYVSGIALVIIFSVFIGLLNGIVKDWRGNWISHSQMPS